MSGKFCKYCQYWLFAYENLGERKGTCDYPCMDSKVTIDPKPDHLVIHTDQYFGCIYFIPVHGNVVTRLPKL